MLTGKGTAPATAPGLGTELGTDLGSGVGLGPGPGGKARRVFPGGNTPRGFHSFYAHILPQDQATRIFVLKGGPGVGKSTLMRRIGEAMQRRGYDVEFHHCSADPGSIDAVVIERAGIAVLDGTAPHVVDPVNPGAIDEIVNLGRYWDEAALRRNRPQIVAASQEASENFQRAYRYLTAARAVYEDIEAINTGAVNFGWLNQQAANLIQQLLGDRPVAPVPGRMRHLFGSALTPEGLLNHLETVVGPAAHKVVIQGEPGTGKATLVQKLAAAAVERGFDVEAFHCPFDPPKPEHLVIPGLDLAVTTSAEPHLWEGPADWVVNTAEALSDHARCRHRGALETGRQAYRQLLETALTFLHRAKELHDEIETYYVPHMHFEAVDRVREQLTERILAYAGGGGDAPHAGSGTPTSA